MDKSVNKPDPNRDLEILNVVETRLTKMEGMIMGRLDKVHANVSVSIADLHKCFNGLQTQVTEIDKQMALMNERQTKLIDLENKFNEEIDKLREQLEELQQTQNLVSWVIRILKWVITILFSGGFIAGIVNLIRSAG